MTINELIVRALGFGLGEEVADLLKSDRANLAELDWQTQLKIGTLLERQDIIANALAADCDDWIERASELARQGDAHAITLLLNAHDTQDDKANAWSLVRTSNYGVLAEWERFHGDGSCFTIVAQDELQADRSWVPTLYVSPLHEDAASVLHHVPLWGSYYHHMAPLNDHTWDWACTDFYALYDSDEYQALVDEAANEAWDLWAARDYIDAVEKTLALEGDEQESLEAALSDLADLGWYTAIRVLTGEDAEFSSPSDPYFRPEPDKHTIASLADLMERIASI